MSLDDLARRAVASKHWRWLPGARVRWTERGEWTRIADGTAHTGRGIPDLADPATLGCLLQLVRDAWGDRPVSLTHDWLTGCWKASIGPAHHEGSTEAAALVAALLAAP